MAFKSTTYCGPSQGNTAVEESSILNFFGRPLEFEQQSNRRNPSVTSNKRPNTYNLYMSAKLLTTFTSLSTPRRTGHWMALVFMATSASLSSLLALPLSPPSQFGREIAGITVGQDHLDRVRSLYGPGAETTIDNVKSLCYYVEQDHSYLSVSAFEKETRVRSISITTIQDVTPGCRDAKVKGKHVKPFAGVALGDSMTAVGEKIGQPVTSQKTQINGHDGLFNSYRLAGGHATCIFAEGKLVLVGIALD